MPLNKENQRKKENSTNIYCAIIELFRQVAKCVLLHQMTSYRMQMEDT